MIEMVLICCYTIPLGVWLCATILEAGLIRDPVAFSVNEMLVLLISTILMASCVYLVRQYKTTKNEGDGYSLLYGLLISSGSMLTALLLASQLYGTGMMPNTIKVILGAVVFIFIPFIGVFRVWLKLRRVHV